MTKVVYGFSGRDIEKLADSISVVTGICLYAQRSPIIGPWYSSQDLSSFANAWNRGDKVAALALAAAAEGQPQVTLTLNDSGDPYYGGAEFPGKGTCLLRVEADPAWLGALEERLGRSGLRYEEVSRSE